LLCQDCHREIEEIIPYQWKLNKRQYIELTQKFLRGEENGPYMPVWQKDVHFSKQREILVGMSEL